MQLMVSKLLKLKPFRSLPLSFQADLKLSFGAWQYEVLQAKQVFFKKLTFIFMALETVLSVFLLH